MESNTSNTTNNNRASSNRSRNSRGYRGNRRKQYNIHRPNKDNQRENDANAAQSTSFDTHNRETIAENSSNRRNYRRPWRGNGFHRGKSNGVVKNNRYTSNPQNKPSIHKSSIEKKFKEVTLSDQTDSSDSDIYMQPNSSSGDTNLRDKLILELRKTRYSCLICMNKVQGTQKIWSCCKCFHIYHLKCVKEWAVKCSAITNEIQSSAGPNNTKWRCPSCQTVQQTSVDDIIYSCFCGKRVNPTHIPGSEIVPHGCDGICGKIRTPKNDDAGNSILCVHRCNEQCHPGPCPACVADVSVSCPCGKEVSMRRCGGKMPPTCGNVCGLLLTPSNGSICALGLHQCAEVCHTGPCPPCDKQLHCTCFCGEKSRVYSCGSEEAQFLELSAVDVKSLQPMDSNKTSFRLKGVFSCDRICGRKLACGNHTCERECHLGPCGNCKYLPQFRLLCPCGKVALSNLCASSDAFGERKQCTDPVPCCPNVCERVIRVCGHKCSQRCHEGPCPPCPLSVSYSCRCGKLQRKTTCVKYAQLLSAQPEEGQVLCEKECKKYKQCARHKCKDKCCDKTYHPCDQICNRMLSCGQHRCEDPCHSGTCPSCWRGVIYDEISCRCGKTVLDPPQPCGTKPPDCDYPCDREHFCFHAVTHKCHNDRACPPCTVLMQKPCPGGHTFLANIPCFQVVRTCGRPCGRSLGECGHTCPRKCHEGECLAVGERCTVRCKEPRKDCGHECRVPCHHGETCDEVQRRHDPCQAKVALKCSCGVRQEELPCHKVQAMVSQMQLQKLAKEESQKLISLPLKSSTVPYYLCDGPAILGCSVQCSAAKAQADKRTAKEQLCQEMWVRGPDAVKAELPSPFGVPEYSNFLKQFAQANITFTQRIEQQIEELVLNTSMSGAKSISTYRFPPMGRYKRKFIVELCEFYGVEAMTCDPEPATHIMLKAIKGICHFPGCSNGRANRLSSVIEAEFKSKGSKSSGTGVGKTIAQARREKELGIIPPSPCDTPTPPSKPKKDAWFSDDEKKPPQDKKAPKDPWDSDREETEDNTGDVDKEEPSSIDTQDVEKPNEIVEKSLPKVDADADKEKSSTDVLEAEKLDEIKESSPLPEESGDVHKEESSSDTQEPDETD